MTSLKKLLSLIPFIHHHMTQVALLLMTDICSGFYLLDQWQTKYISSALIRQSMNIQNIDYRLFDPEQFFKLELKMTQTFQYTLCGLLIWNLFFYYQFIKNKSWAYKYVKNYVWAGVLLSIISLLDYGNTSLMWNMLNGLSCIIYLLIGLVLIRPKSLPETTVK